MLTLQAGENSVVVAPEAGGSGIGWMHGGTAIIRHAEAPAVFGNPHAMGWFPLVPYCNRIAGARFNWQGRDYTLVGNFGDSPHSIHGVGRYRPWTVEQAQPNLAELSLHHEPGPLWPFTFEARLTYRLDDAALAVTISVTNRHTIAVPAGVGLHPYFPRQHAPKLRFHAQGVWLNDAATLPVRHEPVPRDWLHDSSRPAGDLNLDNCFTGWDRVAHIEAGPASLRIEASGIFTNLQVFTPPGAGFFCVEPVSHSPDSINRPDLPADQAMTVLQPGETLEGTVRLILTPEA